MKKCFTLIELLVVVAIIGILFSLLLPNLSKARKVAERTVCATNLKQLGNAINLFLHDQDGFYPDKGPQWENWQGFKLDASGVNEHAGRPLMRYLKLKNGNGLRCPDLDRLFKNRDTTYASNVDNNIEKNLLTREKRITLAQLKVPSSFVTMLPFPAYFWVNKSGVTNFHVPTHGLIEDKRWNLLFADQHVSYERLFGSLHHNMPTYSFKNRL